jgi:hypothetical protein
MEHLLFFLYHNRLPEGLAPSDILALMQVADRFGAQLCLAACGAHFSADDMPALEWDDVAAFYALPESLIDQEGPVSTARAAFEKVLLQKFVKFEEGWRDQATRGAFLELPLAAVQVVASHPLLEAVSENTLSTALLQWHDHERAARRQHSRALAQLITPQRLSHSYFEHIFCRAFEDSLSIKDVAAVASYHAAPEKVKQRMEALLPPPRPAMPTPHKQTLRIDIPVTDLLKMVTHQANIQSQPQHSHKRKPPGTPPDRIDSPPIFINGFYVTLFLRMVRVTGSSPSRFMLCIGCEPQLRCGTPSTAIRPPSTIMKAALNISAANRFVNFHKIAHSRLGGLYSFVKLDIGSEAVHDLRSLLGKLKEASSSSSLPASQEEWEQLMVQQQRVPVPLVQLEATVAAVF